MTDPKNISIDDFTYTLPDSRIALYPLDERDASKLLICKQGIIREDIYKNIAEHIPADSLLIFNNTKVIRARIRFQKETGGMIEIFCLEPYEEINEYNTIMNKKESVCWKCMIGGAGKWKGGELEKQLVACLPDRQVRSLPAGQAGRECEVRAKLIEKLADAYVVEFSWRPAHLSFAEVLEQAGDIPLPPYIKRDPESNDGERYQTIYALDEGSVAAPTAGLHFSEEIFKSLSKKNIQKVFVTLHVGAGTFKPVKAVIMQDHIMHAEWIDVSIEMIRKLATNIDKPITAVGTTSLRTLESLYWMGVKVLLQPELKQVQLDQWEVYEEPLAGKNIAAKDALDGLLNWVERNRLDRLFTQTQILIAPGYHFKMANALITNFHQPRSTLLLLVAAAVGNDWEKIYHHALQHEFRFLSYGDGCLLFINE